MKDQLLELLKFTFEFDEGSQSYYLDGVDDSNSFSKLSIKELQDFLSHF